MGRKRERARVLIPYGSRANVTGTGYLRTAGNTNFTSGRGIRMHRSGSIIGLSFTGEVTVLGTAGTADIEAHVNGSSVLSDTTQTISGTGVISNSVTQDYGTDTFAVGDLIQAHITYNGLLSCTFGQSIMGFIEVEFDT